MVTIKSGFFNIDISQNIIFVKRFDKILIKIINEKLKYKYINDFTFFKHIINIILHESLSYNEILFHILEKNLTKFYQESFLNKKN
jgi:hypothetical protein